MEVRIAEPTRVQTNDEWASSWAQTDRCKVLVHPSDLQDCDPSAGTLCKYSLLESKLSGHVPIQITFKDKGARTKGDVQSPSMSG